MIFPREEYWESPALNNSKLGMLMVSPSLFNAEMQKVERGYLSLGSVVNDILLFPAEVFAEKYYVMKEQIPSAKMGEICKNVARDWIANPELKLTDLVLKYAKEIKYGNYSNEVILKKYIENGSAYVSALIESQGKTIISEELLATANICVSSISRKERALELMTKGASEVALGWNYRGIPCKGLLDKLDVDDENKIVTITDLKTTSENPYGKINTPDYHNIPAFNYYSGTYSGFLRKAIYEYDYIRQLAWYALGAAFQYPGYEIKTFIVVVGTKEPFDCAIYDMTNTLNSGYDRINELIDMIEYHTAKDNWLIHMNEAENGIYLEL